MVQGSMMVMTRHISFWVEMLVTTVMVTAVIVITLVPVMVMMVPRLTVQVMFNLGRPVGGDRNGVMSMGISSPPVNQMLLQMSLL